ncbi:MAG TPA: DUF58 domain-containing protein [bacterium]|nr:DUF58 domain-containing protein [bacterium]
MKNQDSPSILQEVHRLEVVTRGAVETLLRGFYKSSFRGQGLEFDQVREYSPEDDHRAIDWNVTARLSSPFVKTFIEERELQMILAVDLSASLWHGTGPSSKRETALRLCAALAFAAVQHQDRVGLLVFTDRVEYFMPPRRGKAGALRVLRELVGFKPQGRKTDFAPALRVLNSALKRRSVVLLVSDFTDPLPPAAAGVLARRHDLVAAVLEDPIERQLPVAARLAVRDPEGGGVGFLSPASQEARRRAALFRDGQLRLLTGQGADKLEIEAGQNVVPVLMRFFRRRLERMGRR